ncbi:MAG TPA: type IV toxin-antitoxin system AbiEi family antitoxin domain-containing protein, partial [Mycobacteriales bacterium]|nr:type IV toxin-antitoxin system AbiEi family antitoxin domain-containing protein [Mycobacteriales bacterium]
MWRTETPLAALLRRQDGLVTRDQLLAAGVTDGRVRAQLRAGRWRRLTAGLYATFTGELGPEARLLAACLHVGCGAQVTGAAALRWHGL